MSLNEEDILVLPEAPQFISEPPKFTVNEMIALCEPLLPYWNELRFREPPKPMIGEPFKFLPEDL